MRMRIYSIHICLRACISMHICMHMHACICMHASVCRYMHLAPTAGRHAAYMHVYMPDICTLRPRLEGTQSPAAPRAQLFQPTICAGFGAERDGLHAERARLAVGGGEEMLAVEVDQARVVGGLCASYDMTNRWTLKSRHGGVCWQDGRRI